MSSTVDDPPPGSRAGAAAFGLATAVAFWLLQELLLMQPALVELNPEELYNAAHADVVRALGLRALLPLQYRPFCGGCTLDAGLGALLQVALPGSLHTWKLVPIALGAIALGSLSAALWRRRGRPAALGFCLLALATPPSWARLGLVAWGNHYEASAVVVMTLAAAIWADDQARRWWVVGAFLGAGCWVGFSAAFAVPVVLLWLLLEHRPRALAWLLPGLLIGFAPALLRWWQLGQSPFSTIYQAGESVPLLTRIPAKLGTLLPPRQLAGILGIRQPLLGPATALAALLSAMVAAVLTWRQRGAGRLPALLVAGWLAVYLVVRFQVSVGPPGVIPTPGDVRYAAPAIILGLVLVSQAAALTWRTGRRRVALALTLPWLLAGAGGRLAALASPFPVTAARQIRAADFEYFREQASWALPDELRRAAASSDDSHIVAVAAYAEGRRALLAAIPEPERATAPAPLAAVGDQPAWAEGVAGALTDRLDPDADGDSPSLRRAASLLDALASTWPAGWKQRARRTICWRRADGGAADAVLADAGDGAGLARLLRAAGDDAPWQQALAWCAGRRWGRDRAERWQPKTLALPRSALADPVIETQFAAGLGRALGEAWGQGAIGVSPPWRSAESGAAYDDGVVAGSRQRWLSEGEW